MVRSYREVIQTPTDLKLSEVIEVPDSEDPSLCSKCQKHGYCISKYYKHPTTN